MEVKIIEIKSIDDYVYLKAGEIVYITGEIVSARDKAHMRAVKLIKEGKIEEVPEELFSLPIYHCGPLLKDGKVISAGPTTSARMNEYSPLILSLSKCPVIVGKGGMSDEVVEKLRGKGCYLAYPGGAGALAAERIKRIKKIYWEDLGMAEAVYVMEVEKFGPCVVAIDSEGRNLYKREFSQK